MVCGKIRTDRRWIKRSTVHITNLNRNFSKPYNLTFSLPYFSGYIWQLRIPQWLFLKIFTYFWFIFFPSLSQFLSSHPILKKKKEKKKEKNHRARLGLACNSLCQRNLNFSACVSLYLYSGHNNTCLNYETGICE